MLPATPSAVNGSSTKHPAIVQCVNGTHFVWDVQDALRLRLVHRVVLHPAGFAQPVSTKVAKKWTAEEIQAARQRSAQAKREREQMRKEGKAAPSHKELKRRLRREQWNAAQGESSEAARAASSTVDGKETSAIRSRKRQRTSYSSAEGQAAPGTTLRACDTTAAEMPATVPLPAPAAPRAVPATLPLPRVSMPCIMSPEAVALALQQGWIAIKGPSYVVGGGTTSVDATPVGVPTNADGGRSFVLPGLVRPQRVCRHCPPPSPRHAVRNAVYADLWRKGYHVSSGSKFGGDFLAYAGDPQECHASFIVVVALPDEVVEPSSFLGTSRVSVIARKHPVLASVSGAGEVKYVWFRWVPDPPRRIPAAVKRLRAAKQQWRQRKNEKQGVGAK